MLLNRFKYGILKNKSKEFNKIGTGVYESISIINLELRDRFGKIAE